MFYIQEITKLMPGRFDEFVKATETEQVPLYHDLGFRLAAYWETVHTQGYWPEAISLWEMDDFQAYARICASQYSKGALGKRYRNWQAHLGTLATECRGLVLWPSSGTPSLEQMQKSGKQASPCLHKTVIANPNKSWQYMEQVQKLYAPAAGRYGSWMVGSYFEVWGTRATSIWALEGWEAVGKHQQEMRGDPDILTWSEVSIALLHDWEDRLLVHLPFSPI